jgi:MGT family glycosyltransferase
MTKVLLLNSPLYGHVYPTLALAQELVQRGEEVTYYLTEEFEQAVTATGATFRLYHSTRRPHDAMSGDISRFQIEECRHVVPQVLEAVLAVQPDYILYESICLWGGLVAHRLRVPIIRCNTMIETNDHFMILPSKFLSPATFALTVLEAYNNVQSLRDLCEVYHLPRIENLDARSLFFHAEDLNIVCVPRSFQPASETFDERFVFVGPCLVPRIEANASLCQTWLSPLDHPTLYISLGTIFNAQALFFFQQCIHAFGDQPWRVILAIGQHVERTELGSIPDNIQVYSHVPQLEVLKHSLLFLTHGGNNSIMEALSCGVPMVVVPHNSERAVNAKRVAELGLGMVIEPEAVSAERLREAVSMVATDPGFRQRVQQMQATIQAAGGVRRAVDAILQFVSSRSLEERF